MKSMITLFVNVLGVSRSPQARMPSREKLTQAELPASHQLQLEKRRSRRLSRPQVQLSLPAPQAI